MVTYSVAFCSPVKFSGAVFDMSLFMDVTLGTGDDDLFDLWIQRHDNYFAKYCGLIILCKLVLSACLNISRYLYILIFSSVSFFNSVWMYQVESKEPSNFENVQFWAHFRKYPFVVTKTTNCVMCKWKAQTYISFFSITCVKTEVEFEPNIYENT